MLHRYPFLRLFFPLALGVYCGDVTFYQGQSGWTAFSFYGLLLFLFALLIVLYFLKRYSYRWLFGAFLMSFFFMLGVVRMNGVLRQSEFGLPNEKAAYRAVITEKPKKKERVVVCQARIEPIRPPSCPSSRGPNGDAFSTGQTAPVTRQSFRPLKALLHIGKDSLSERLTTGDELLVYASLSPPTNNGNPDEFDYARFLARTQVSVIGFAYNHDWKLLAQSRTHTFKEHVLGCRETVLEAYRRLGFTGDDLAVLSALTVGYKEELSEDIRETYSISGASHVLALSGLHIGLLYALFWFFLRRLPGRYKGIALLRVFLLVLLLWGFAVFTGFSASVVRSVTMFSLFAIAGLFGRKPFSLNTLLAAGFFMLLFYPCWLFDVGFQLSFCAVAVILLLQPRLFRLIPFSSRGWKYVWGVMSVSIAAQIGTSPLVLLYFSRFSTHFLLTNLFVVPLVSIIMYLAVLLLLFMPFPMMQSWVALVLRVVIDLLNGGVRWVERLPLSSVDGVWVDRVEVVGIYLFLLLSLRYLFVHKGKTAMMCLSCLFFISAWHVAMRFYDRPRQGVRFYNVHDSPVVHCIASDGRSWLAYADSLPDQKGLCKAVSGYWLHARLKAPQPVFSDFKDGCLACDNHIVAFSGCRICIVNDDRWRNKKVSQPLLIDYLYLCEGHAGDLRGLVNLFAARSVILDSSLPEYKKQAYEEECRQLGIRYISLSEKGSVCFLL